MNIFIENIFKDIQTSIIFFLVVIILFISCLFLVLLIKKLISSNLKKEKIETIKQFLYNDGLYDSFRNQKFFFLKNKGPNPCKMNQKFELDHFETNSAFIDIV